MALRVNLEHLATSAVQVTGHGEDLATSHLSVDDRIAGAQGGWTGRSAQALARRTPQWSNNSTALVTQLGDHATHLSTCGQSYSEMEARHTHQIDSQVRP
ncbi:WXG100 family type VII secretion target [Candidatus Mycobacterium wuenschmannii]|uniref:WXG100 family type VII secretion target n=1 Tax=Candidatus Mycobacterium wuenschmannii TaxID=3027808 RepID=A0ABY8VWT7_9MYCO|nr:WXG100 family type VII secretion target [Candidatus Mycobacterium wuenschmannii]WIM87396.1 WXG100 family type VII secretion target [Candidatus Mycobacterium wuenschmannii]